MDDRIARTLIFLSVASLIWLSAHLYVGLRLLDRSVPHRRRWLALVALISLIGPGTMVAGSLGLGATAMVAMSWVGFGYMGLFALVFPLVVVRDIGRLAWRGGTATAAWLRRGGKVGATASGAVDAAAIAGDPVAAGRLDGDRRRFLLNASHAGILGASGLLSGVGVVQARRLAEVVQVTVPVPHLHADLDGYRIAQISDVHVGLTIRRPYLEAIVERTNGLGADFIAVTGDLIDGYVPDLRHEVAALGELAARDGVFYVTGNHEYYWDAEAWVAEVARLGLRVLNNEHRVLAVGNARLVVAGVTDLSAGNMLQGHASDARRALDGAPPADYRILLAHQPRSFPAAQRAGADLVLSGHTHGGQLFPWTLFVGLAHPFGAGLSQVAGAHLYVSRGTGYWGPPMRLGAPAEITLLTLRTAHTS